MRFSILLLLFVSEILLAQPKTKYVIGVEAQNYLPYFRTDGKTYVGFARELFDLFGAHAQIEFVYADNPVKRIYSNFFDKKSQLDFKFPDRPEWAPDLRKGITVHYSSDIVEFTDGVMVKPERLGKGLGALKNLGTVDGFTPFEYKSKIKDPKTNPGGEINLYGNSGLPGLIGQVAAGRIDGIYINVAVAKYVMNELKTPGAVVFDKELPHTQSFYQMSTLKHPEVIKKFNEFLVANKAQIAVLKQKWGI